MPITTAIAANCKTFDEAPGLLHQLAMKQERLSDRAMTFQLSSRRFHRKWDVLEAFAATSPEMSEWWGMEIIDGVIHFTCDEGPVGDGQQPVYRMIVAPKPDDADYYCAWGTVNQDTFEERLRTAGYFGLTEDRLQSLPMYRSEPGAFGYWYHWLKAVGRLLDANPRLMSKLPGSKEDFFASIFERCADGRHKWYPNLDCEKKLGYELLKEAYPHVLEEARIMTDDRVRSRVQTVFGVPGIDQYNSQAGVMLVPPKLYAGMLAMAESGWNPLIPTWIRYNSCLYNGTLGRGCGNISINSNNGTDYLPREQARPFWTWFNNTTLHIPQYPLSVCASQPDEKWEDTFVETCLNLAHKKIKTQDDRIAGNILGVSGCRDIPLIIRCAPSGTETEGSTEYWELISFRKTNGFKGGVYNISVASRVGEPIFDSAYTPEDADEDDYEEDYEAEYDEDEAEYEEDEVEA